MRAIFLTFVILFLSLVQLNAQWYEQNSSTNEYLTSVFFIDENTGWACGSNGKIIKTTDGGTNWFSQNSSTTVQLTEIQFINPNTGWACGYGGIILSTTDGGVNWNSITLDDSSSISAIQFVNNLVGWIAVYYPASSSSKIFKSTDGGYNWISQVEIDSVLSIEDIFFLDENTGWVSGADEFGIYKTTDGGNVWTNYPNSFSTLQELYFISSQVGWICHNALGAAILSKTTDGGITWTGQWSDNTKNIYSISFINENVGYAAGLNFLGFGGYIMQTTDGGTTWIEQYNGTQQLMSIFFRNGLLGWAVGSQGRIVNTVNGGLPVELTSFIGFYSYPNVKLNWSTATELNNQGFEIERSSDETNWIIIGFKDGNGTTTEPQVYSFLDDVSEIINSKLYYRLKQVDFNGSFEYSEVIKIITSPTKFALEQNYPNPFNPSTSIQYAISSRQFVTLKVYDVLGNEIATLVNEYRNAGSYEIEFDASKLSSGVYYYQLRSGDFIQTKKMILLK
jgi:photosystem II stability/assembly factor-like uncharacterized protein